MKNKKMSTTETRNYDKYTQWRNKNMSLFTLTLCLITSPSNFRIRSLTNNIIKCKEINRKGDRALQTFAREFNYEK
jgi:hypothetical protein